MTSLSTSAPGKLVIAGEYAVLHGGAALAIAVGCRARASVVTAEDWSLRIANTGRSYGFSLSDGAVIWDEDPGADGSILAAAIAVLTEHGAGLTAAGPLAIELCSREFFRQGEKLGLGSSAAVTVALSGCLQHLLSGSTSLDLALRVHRSHQRGQGSGIDVVTSYQGGVVALREDGQISNVDWPAGLHILPVWTGRAASTPQMLAQLADFAVANPGEHNRLIGGLATTAGAARYACDGGDVPALLAWLDEYGMRLRELDEATSLGIWSQEHSELAQLAADIGVIYKPSGAGGGDFGLAFTADPDAGQRFTAACAQAGYEKSALELAAPGLSVTG